MPARLAGTHQDVTALKLIEEHQRQLQDALRHQAFHDALTGLANRALFYEQLTQALAPQEGRGRGAGQRPYGRDKDQGVMVTGRWEPRWEPYG